MVLVLEKGDSAELLVGSLADSGGCSSPSGSIRPLGRGEGGGERRINTDGASVQHADTCTINKANTDSVSTILPPSFLHTSYVHVCLGDNSVTQMMARCSPNLSQGVRLPPPPPPPLLPPSHPSPPHSVSGSNSSKR